MGIEIIVNSPGTPDIFKNAFAQVPWHISVLRQGREDWAKSFFRNFTINYMPVQLKENDKVYVEGGVEYVGNTSATYRSVVRHDSKTVSEARFTTVYISKEGSSIGVPESIRNQAHEGNAKRPTLFTEEENAYRLLENLVVGLLYNRAYQHESGIQNIVGRRVKQSEIDSNNHVNFEVYLGWCAEGISAMMENYGLSDGRRQNNANPAITQIEIDYDKQVYLENKPLVHTFVEKTGDTSVTYRVLISCDGIIASRARFTISYYDPDGNPINLPSWVKGSLPKELEMRPQLPEGEGLDCLMEALKSFDGLAPAKKASYPTTVRNLLYPTKL